jgi:hypothetical protein
VTRWPGRARPIAAGLAIPAAARGDAGMVTAEFAVALPAFVVVVIAALCGVAVVTAQLRCVDAADVAARMAARGDSPAVVRATALAGAPGSAQLDVVTSAQTVTATVRARVSPLGLTRILPGVVVQAHVVDAREPAPPAVADQDSR